MDDVQQSLENINRSLNQIRIGDVMTQPVTVVDEEEEFSVVEEIFIEKNIHHLPVINDKKQIVGIISQKDVYRSIAPRRRPDGELVYRKGVLIDGDGFYEKESLNSYILTHLMHKNPEVLDADKTLGDAIELMVKHQKGCVPIVDDHRQVIGILTRFDIVRIISMNEGV